MPKKPKELERIILEDGWVFKIQTGSHRHYTPKGTENSILKQAGLK